ncbi:ATP-binding cassette domain-containing protein [Jatrophihabitans sp.]|uniref:ABC transporter ATP-binding protein n=1 Tax=Jatrophihabitans sp. TaxID=1932789 RepID=UPI0030C7853A|nr:Sulfate-transporting ATPase [Jatrophihabitans sp.]
MTTDTGLTVENLTVRYGGHVAVSNVSLSAPAGSVTGLIGPNGAGKTTTLNACFGVVKSAGEQHLFGVNMTRKGAVGRSRLGMTRTFQRMRLFDTLTVEENVSMGREAKAAGTTWLTQFVSSPASRRQCEAATRDALNACGIEELRDRTVRNLSTGQRRLVEFARAIANEPRFLLLDEPSSGLDVRETEGFGTVLESIVRDRGIGVLLVEHDMSLVSRVCRYVYVLDFGIKIFEGTMSETLTSPLVRAAYLGQELTDVPAGSDA